MNFAKRQDLLSFDELHFLSRIFCSLGVTKIRITGGEPFVRNGIIPFLGGLTKVEGLEEITVTTNGTLSLPHIASLKAMGIRKINISIDSLDKGKFFQITRRDKFDEVYATIFTLLNEGFEVKLNCVVSATKNTDEIIPFVELTKEHKLRVRFLEEMPFNGSSDFDHLNWTSKDVMDHILKIYTSVSSLKNEPNSTSLNYQVEGYKGSFGVIPSFSRTFCGTCNRIRLSAKGELRTCLYGQPAANLRDLLRSGAGVREIEDTIIEAVQGRARNGFEAEASSVQDVRESMSVLGG